MKNATRSWKTTVCGLAVIAASTICPVLGVPAAICAGLVSFFTGAGLVLGKDHDVTGGTRAK